LVTGKYLRHRKWYCVDSSWPWRRPWSRFITLSLALALWTTALALALIPMALALGALALTLVGITAWLACLLKVRDLSRVTPRSLTKSDRSTLEPTTLMWEILDNVLFRCWVLRRIASDLVGFKARQLRENHWNRSASADSSVWRSAVADDWEIEMKSWVSSAYWCWLAPQRERREATRKTYMVKRRGPRTEPRGTPDADRQKIMYISARIHDSNGIPTVTPMFPGSDNRHRLLGILFYVCVCHKLKVAAVNWK